MEHKYFNVPELENLTNEKEKEFRVYSAEKNFLLISHALISDKAVGSMVPGEWLCDWSPSLRHVICHRTMMRVGNCACTLT